MPTTAISPAPLRCAGRRRLGPALLAGLLAALLGGGCGPDPAAGPGGSLQAALRLPRALADELASVTVYVYRVDEADGEPSRGQLLAESPPGSGRYEAYEDFSPFKQTTIAFQTSQAARISGLPDRGPVWLFYARGYDSSPLLITHGAAGPLRVTGDSDAPTEVTITLDALPER
jgi:hypothetical protein